MDKELGILDPVSESFVVGDRAYEIRELPIRKLGRVITRLYKIITLLGEKKPNVEIDADSLSKNITEIIEIAQDDIFNLLTKDILNLNESEKEIFLDTCPTSIAIKMLRALIKVNKEALNDFFGLADDMKQAIPAMRV